MAVREIWVTGLGVVAPSGAGAFAAWQGLRSLPVLDQETFPGFHRCFLVHRTPDFPCDDRWKEKDRSIQLAAAACREACKDAALHEIAPQRIGCTFSSSKGGIIGLLAKGKEGFADFPPHAVGGALAAAFGWRGPCFSIAAACATGAASIIHGARLIQNGEADAVVCGATEASLAPLMLAAFHRMGLLTRTGSFARPFHPERDGFCLGEGAGALVLESADSALRRNKKAYAVLEASALAQDGTHPLKVEADGRSLEMLLNRLHREIDPRRVDWVKTHGTGTLWNDAMEAEILQRFYPHRPWVQSWKGRLGHLLGASGAVETVLALLCLERGEIPMPDWGPWESSWKIQWVPPGGIKAKLTRVVCLAYGIGGHLAALLFARRESADAVFRG